MNKFYCGIDIAKDTAMFSLIDNESQRLTKSVTFANSKKGFNESARWLRRLVKKHKPFHIYIIMEATGVYYCSLAKFFSKQNGMTVSVVNPAQIKDFAKASLVRTKTDAVDACVIARFGLLMKPREWAPPEPHEEEMLAIVRHIDAIKAMIQSERNRLHHLETIGDATLKVQKTIKKTVKFLEKQIYDLTDGLKKLAEEHPGTDDDIKRLCSIPGVGETTAFSLLVEIGDVTRFASVKQLVAHAGLAPKEHTSGSSVRGRVTINKRGAKKLRKSLYMPAMVAMRYNPLVKELYSRLVLAGKTPKLALVACMRKLLHIAYGVLKNKNMFNENYGKIIV